MVFLAERLVPRGMVGVFRGAKPKSSASFNEYRSRYLSALGFLRFRARDFHCNRDTGSKARRLASHEHDQETQIRTIPALCTEERWQDRPAQEPGDLLLARRRRAARARSAVLQTSLASQSSHN